jgi:hemoglobin/transferrin/lactoferrin receptor protein
MARALWVGVSIGAMGAMVAQTALAQRAPPQAEPVQPQKPKPAKKKRAAAKPAVVPAPVADANAQAPSRGQSLDEITVTASKTEERAIDALAPASVVSLSQIQLQQPSRLSHLFYAIPGVYMNDRGDDPSTAINIRGLQDFGRVAVVVDGARQNYQRSGHNANGSFFLDPELVGSIDITRGPTANIYGSGAIGGVVSFRTKDIDDVLRPGERWGIDTSGQFGSNNSRMMGSVFGGVRVDPTTDVFGGVVYRSQGNYQDGNGTEIGNTGNDIASGLMKLTVRPLDGH